ncbi:dihydroneopterin aldolase [Prochlorococcus sp. MIT 1307]|uniref:dihydroneopterin aldolase n=1 Tax=Prochlorococcus sp. MIT 1307 TaxID=3096219 RepID=UPI002A75811C|nr:dihydroneopterin aldolase [Prochlorococcus sp. MIT 1307]
MSGYQSIGAIHVNNVNLWAHVGVLDQERLHGQSFLLDFSLWLDLKKAALNDDLSATADYSLAIKDLQQIAFQLNCKTIERFSELILDRLECIYGPIPMKVFLRKCSAPISGFGGSVGVERSRYFPPQISNDFS